MSQKSILAFFGKPGAKVAAKPIASKKKTPSKPSVEPEKRKRTPESKGAPAPDSAPLGNHGSCQLSIQTDLSIISDALERLQYKCSRTGRPGRGLHQDQVV